MRIKAKAKTTTTTKKKMYDRNAKRSQNGQNEGDMFSVRLDKKQD